MAARDLDRASKFANEFKIPKAFGSYEDLAKESTVDVVYIGVIHPEHCRLSLLMLNNGKHVLCEKPATMNLKQLKKVVKTAQEKKLFFMEGLWSRFFPAYDKVRSELDSQSLGEVRYVQAEFCQPIIDLPRLHRPELGGGGLLDIGIYVLQFALMVIKEKPENILASGFLHESGVDLCASIILKYQGKRMMHLMYHTGIKAKNNAVIYGTKGMIEVDSPFWAPTKIRKNDEEMEFPLPSTDAKFNFVNSAGFSYEAECVRKCIENGNLECPLFPHSESIAIMSMMDEIREQLGVKYDVDDIELE